MVLGSNPVIGRLNFFHNFWNFYLLWRKAIVLCYALCCFCCLFRSAADFYTQCCHALTLALARLSCWRRWTLKYAIFTTFEPPWPWSHIGSYDTHWLLPTSLKKLGSKNMLNSRQFYITSDFDCEYLRNEQTYPKSERHVIVSNSFCIWQL